VAALRRSLGARVLARTEGHGSRCRADGTRGAVGTLRFVLLLGIARSGSGQTAGGEAEPAQSRAQSRSAGRRLAQRAREGIEARTIHQGTPQASMSDTTHRTRGKAAAPLYTRDLTLPRRLPRMTTAL